MALSNLVPALRNLVKESSWMLIPALTIAVLCAGIAYQEHHRLKRFAAHDAGKVYRSAYLEPGVVQQLVAQHKIRTVVNLCEEAEAPGRIEAERKAAEAAGAKFVNLVFPKNKTSDLNYDSIRAMEALFADESAYPIYVHCQHGLERTAKALSMYDIARRGMPANESLGSMADFGREHPEPIVSFAKNYEQATQGGRIALQAGTALRR